MKLRYQINDLEHKEPKNSQSEQQEERNTKKGEYCKEPLGQLQALQNLYVRVARRRERTINRKYLKKQ